MKSKKLLSLLLALMMMLSVVPFYASAAEALSTSNVTTWPTISYKRADGIMYFGEKVGDALIINDDEVVTDANGNTVAGHFEFIDPTALPRSFGSNRADIKFVPDDESTYTGFEKKRCGDVKFDVTKTTPVPVDENDTIPVATKVEAGATLATSTLSGAKYTNPYNAEEPRILALKWYWVDETIEVTESGYYEAAFGSGNYNQVFAQVYVGINVDIVETSISEIPTIPELTYDGVTTWNDITLSGGVAVEKDTTNPVEGTFAITDNWKWQVIEAGTYEIDVTFTPNDIEAYKTVDCKVPVTVNKALLKFLDENGNEVVPEYTIPYGTTLSNYQSPIFYECKKYLNTGDENIRLYFSEEDSKTMFPVGTHELTIGAAPYYTTSNFIKNDDLKVKITVEPKTLNPKICSSTEGYYVVDNSAVFKPKGTFDVYVNDELIASGVAYNSGKVKWEATENGTYVMKFVYNPVENDSFIIDDVTTTMNIIFPNTLTYSSDKTAYLIQSNSQRELYETNLISPGATISVGVLMDKEYFGTWIITDADGNAVDLGIADLTATEITFTMPDYDIIITSKTAQELAADNCDHLCHSDFFLAKIVWKMLNIIFRLFDVQQYCDCGNLHYDAPYIDLGL